MTERPTWLDLAAYSWPEGLSDEAILERLLALNLDRAAATKPTHG